MKTEKESELLKEVDVSRQYRFSCSWLRKCRRLQTGPPFIRVSGMVFYSRKDLDAFVAAHRVEPNGRNSRGGLGAQDHSQLS